MGVIGTVEEVMAERFRQRDELGFTEEHDDRISLQAFGWLLGSRAVALTAPDEVMDKLEARRQLVEIAAIACAAIEKIDRQADG